MDDIKLVEQILSEYKDGMFWDEEDLVKYNKYKDIALKDPKAFLVSWNETRERMKKLLKQCEIDRKEFEEKLR